MQRIVVIGGKGTAINVAENIADAADRFGHPVELLGFAIDDLALGSSINGFPVLCGTRETNRLFTDPSVRVIFCLYKPELMQERVALLQSLQIPPSRFATFIHPSAYVARSAHLAEGSVILAHAAVQSNVTLGSCCIVNANSVLEHDTAVGPNCFVAAGAMVGANVRIGKGCFLGLNCTLREQISVGDFAFVGMGANVIRHVPPETVVYGNPASEQR
jgi:sugar O-acyltransferase (sialic acid O-acetyltransferase NeuD family)